MKELVEFAKANGLTVSACESLTAGLFMASVAEVPGASAVLQGGFVTYSAQLKEKLAGVDASIIEKHGVVSAECATAMAEGTRIRTNTDYSVSFTGNAGPDTLEGKPAGLVYCAVAGKDNIHPYKFQYHGLERNELRKQLVADMACRLLEIMKEEINGHKETDSGKTSGQG